VIWGSQDERRPNPTKGTRPPLPTDERDSERGEGDLDELERRTGGQGWFWRLNERGLEREEGKREEGRESVPGEAKSEAAVR